MAKKVNLTKKSANNYSKYLYKSRKKPIIATVSLVGILAVIVAFFGIQMYNKNKIESAKTSIKNFSNAKSAFKYIDAPYADSDFDGVINVDEQKYETNYLNADTDGDGIKDGDEIMLKTDPLKADTDDDGIPDGVELLAGTDPQSPTTNGTPDNEREFSYDLSNDEVSATITGDAFVYATLLEKIKLIGFSANSSIISDTYEIYNDHSFKTCKISFAVDKKYIGSDISIYKFDVNQGGFEKINSQVNKDESIVSAEISSFGTYMVAENSTIAQEAATRVHFLIDNSGSMYPEEIIPNSPENDVDFKRLEFAKKLIEKFDDSYTVAISKFTKDYTLMQDFTSDRKALNNALDGIKDCDENFNGTYIQASLEKCIASFKDINQKTINIIVLITDGDSTEDSKPDVDYIEKLADGKNVIIITISIGNNIDKSILNSIASHTDGKYYSASDANLLGDIHNQIVTALNYDKISIDEDISSYGNIGYALYNTGFVPSVNGFSFDDYKSINNDSMSYGLCIFARDWFTKDLALKKASIDTEAGASDGYDLKGTVFEKQLGNGKNLRDFSFIALTTSRFIDPTKYLDFKDSDGEVLKVSQEIRSEALKKGWVEKKFVFDNKVLNWTSANFLVMDINNKYDLIEQSYGKDEASFYKAIDRLNLEFYAHETVGVTLSTGFTRLTGQLSNGIPAVLTIDGEHAVNAISLVRNAQNPSEYILKVYDPQKKDRVTDIIIKKSVSCVVAKDGTVKQTSLVYSSYIDGKAVAITVY